MVSEEKQLAIIWEKFTISDTDYSKLKFWNQNYFAVGEMDELTEPKG